jgi:acetyl-CoA/propionyl-CoA carboxylase biotin carboxyl carrier protein
LLLGAEAFRGSHSEEPIFLEKFLGNPKHIEVQVAIDQHSHAVLIGTRNCSLQRNCQKTIEEAPATIPELSKIQEMAIAIANEMINEGYTHLATIEFLVQDGNIYFLEVNPRIQVEHGITEAIADIDLIALKCWIARGKRMIDFLEQALTERNIASHHTSASQMIELLRQHSPVKFAIEARVEALRFRQLETGELQKIPVQGTISEVRLPDPATDCGIQCGTKINNLKTNPLLALVIGHGATREDALWNLLQKLNETIISGVPTNLERLRDNIQYLLDHPNLDIDTSTTKLLDARTINESMQEHEEKQSRYQPTLFREPNVFATGKSRLPVERHHPSVGRSGSWD